MFAVNVYNFRFAVLCVVLATASAYCVLTLASSEPESQRWRKAARSAVLAATLGWGVWAAAGIGLASLPQAGSTSYMITGLLGSFAVSVAGSWATLYAAATTRGRVRALGETSVLLAATIIATHLTAVYSLRLSGGWTYHLPALYGATLVALAGSCLTAAAAFRHPTRTAELRKSKEPAAALLGLTIAGAFYFVLGGVTPGSGYAIAEPGGSVRGPILAALAVGAALVSILGSAAVTAVADRKVFLRALAKGTDQKKSSESAGVAIPAAQTGMYQASLDGRILDVNEACARLWGYESRDGARGSDLRAHFGEPDEFTKLVLNLELNGGAGTQELQFSKLDGSVLWVLHNASIINRVGESARVIQATFLDITAQRFQRAVPVPPLERAQQPGSAFGPNQPAANLLSLGTAVAFSSKRVLLADQSPASRQALVSLLECWQVNPIIADSREQLAKQMREAEKSGTKIDLLLLDSLIAGKGFSFVEQLRRDFKLVPPVLIVLDGTDRAPGTEALRSAGITACLFKPVWRTDLGQAMLEALFGKGPYPQKSEPETTGTQTEKDSRLRL